MPRSCLLFLFLFLAGGFFDSLSWAALGFSLIIHLWKLKHVVIVIGFLWTERLFEPWSIYCYNFSFTLGAAQVHNGVACRILNFFNEWLLFDSVKDVPVLSIHHFFWSALVKFWYNVNESLGAMSYYFPFVVAIIFCYFACVTYYFIWRKQWHKSYP